MSKALIVTLYGNFNYGNKFQNYAIQNVLKKYFNEVYTLTSSKIWRPRKNEAILKFFPKVFFMKKESLERKKYKNFEKFSQNYIAQCVQTDSKKLGQDFDSVCIGSDQIWNPYYYDNFYYSFGKFSKNVFSYAASIGINEIPENYQEDMKIGLNRLKHISVREEKGAEIVENLTGERPKVLIDPTMLLTAEEWDKIIEKPKRMPKKEYIFTYFLGEYSKERREYIKKIAEKNNLEIVSLGQIEDDKYFCSSPSEFLYLIKNSKIIFTDSFHGSVFSILYKRPFYILNREGVSFSMNSRIDTLIKKFNLENREINNYAKQIDMEYDYSEVQILLENERKKAIEFLENSLKEQLDITY